MLRKLTIALSVAVALSLVLSGLTFASKGLPTWETAFDPGPYMPGDYYLINAVEEYKGDLYAVAGDPLYFYWDEMTVSAGQIFRSPDGVNWEPASEMGFGLGAVEDGCNPNYYDTSRDMTVFQGKLYVLPFESCYLRPGLILRSSDGNDWENVATSDGFVPTWINEWDEVMYGQFHKLGVFNGMLYTSIDYNDPDTNFTAVSIFRSPTGDPGTWEKVMNFPGWGWPGSFHLFKGALYVASDRVFGAPNWDELPEQIWRTYDGVNWEMVVGDGFGNPGTDGLGGFADYKGYLYVGVGTYEGGGGQIWRSKDGNQWEPVVMDGFGNPMDEKIDGLVVYHGDLYAYTVNWEEGGSVFRTKDAKTWERVNDPGWGNMTFATSQHESAQVVFKDDLYMGVIGPQGILLKLVHPAK